MAIGIDYYITMVSKIMSLVNAEKSIRPKVLGAKPKQAGKNSFPPTPFLFAHPSVQFGARSAPSILFKIGSDFVI